MKRNPPAHPRPLRRRGAARVIPAAEGTAAADTLVEHPDGWYWTAADGRQQFGPFATREEAVADRDRGDEAAPTEGESVQEAEAEIGLAGWIDPETGEPAEGQSVPRIEER